MSLDATTKSRPGPFRTAGSDDGAASPGARRRTGPNNGKRSSERLIEETQNSRQRTVYKIQYQSIVTQSLSACKRYADCIQESIAG